MKPKSPNHFDALVERLITEFTKIPNFDLVNKDVTANKVFNIISFRVSDLSSYRDLVCNSFIPATNKAIVDAQNDFRNSKYKHLLSLKDLDFSETHFDTIRLAYVGLFHKLENYVNDLVKMIDLIFAESYTSDIPIDKWAKEKFKFDIRDWQLFPTSFQINWICNCVKHKDGFPIKVPKPDLYSGLDETKRISLTVKDFRISCDLLLELYPVYIQALIVFAAHKAFVESGFSSKVYSEELLESRKATLDSINENVQTFVDSFKNNNAQTLSTVY